MLYEKEIHISNEIYEKNAIIYYDTDVKSKACILYFHGGGLLYGVKTDLHTLNKENLTKAG